jgi:hypothetical protein
VVSGVRVWFEDIDSIQVRGIQWGPTVVIIVGAVATGIVFLPSEPTFSTDNAK